MNMQILIFILLFSVTIASSGQKMVGYKFIGSREYKYNHKGERIEKQTFDADNNRESFVCYKYDVNGNKIETLKFSKDSVLLTRYVYFFNAENHKIRNIKIDYEENEETHKTYFNNEKGENIRTEYFDANGLIKYSEVDYTEKGEFQSRKSFSKDGKLSYAYDYEYLYKNGRVVLKKRFSKGKLASITSYEYDKNGFKISYASHYVSNRRTSKKRLYKYNNEGQCVQSLVYEKIKSK